MKFSTLCIFVSILCCMAGSNAANANNNVHVTYHWHLHQPIYWPDHTPGLNRYQFAADSVHLKKSGQNLYAGDPFAHPRNALADEGGEYDQVFTKDDRKLIYQFRGKDAIQSLFGHWNAGASVSYSGSLMENINSFGKDWQHGYVPYWNEGYKTARSWVTSSGKPRADMVGMTYHHSFSPLLPKSVFRKEVQIFKEIWWKSWGGNPDQSDHSKGFWPIECAFSESLIPILKEEGYDWSIIANSHLARTAANYMDVAQRGNSGWNMDPPNRADRNGPVVPANQWWQGTIDGRGGTFPAPFAYQAHKAKYVDPETGYEYKIDVVPMCDLLSYQNGFGSMGTGDIDANIAPFNDPSQPSIVLLAHDGDNAWGGGASYYQESVPGFMNEAASKGYEPSTIAQFLSDHPVPEWDVVHVEDGAWVNAANDWGHPQYINWLWPPQRTNGDPEKISSDPRTWPDAATGWTEDFRNWAVLIAGANYCETAEQITRDNGESVETWKIQEPYQKNGTYNNPNYAELAWHFYLGGLDSGFMYYGTSLDDEVKQTIACNRSLNFAGPIVGDASQDKTPPTVFKPQRYPWNPGGMGWGPTTGYKPIGFDGKDPWPSEFTVWTHVFDVSGVSDVTLYVRADHDGFNPVISNDNETYAGGPDVGPWVAIPMNKRVLSKTFNGDNNQIEFFETPVNIADTYYAKVTGYRDQLVDYYVSATDTKGYTHKSDIQHVYVEDDGSVTNPPAIPENLTAASGGTNSIELAWSEAEYASYYVVSRGGSVIGTTENTAYTDSGLPSDSTACYTVSATNDFGSSAASDEACATTDRIILPGIPTNVTAVATGLKTIDVSWAAATGALGYVVYRDGSYIADETGVSFADNALSPSTEYCYTVYAYNNHGYSDISEEGCATTDTPVPPEAPVVSALATGVDSIDVTWSAVSGAVSYTVKRDGTVVATTAATSYSAGSLSDDTEYCFTVFATDAYLSSTDSVEACATTDAIVPPNPPASVTATSTLPDRVNVSWSTVSGAASYTIKRDGLTIATVNETTYTAEGLAADTEYCFTIFATDAYASSVDSVSACATTANFIPVTYIGGTYQWPPQGQIDPRDDFWVNTESAAIGAAVTGRVIYTIDNGSTWKTNDLDGNGIIGNREQWHAKIGKLPGNTTIRYKVELEDAGGNIYTDDNSGNFFENQVNPGEQTWWVGHVSHWPYTGQITENDNFWVNVDTYRIGSAISATLVYSFDGATWYGEDMRLAGQHNNNDWWHINLGKLPSGTVIEYAILVIDGQGREIWKKDGSVNFTARVN